jgi:DNA-binding transcriptional LysR family regulator
MSKPKQDQLDTHLLRVLHTLLSERSVTRAAIKLGQSQPAVSNTLKRLREITGDAILVRSKNGMTVTLRGEELFVLAKQGLQIIDSIANPPPLFVPASTQRVFNLGAPDYLSVLLIPAIIEKIRTQAPHASLVVHALNAGFDYVAALENGTLDCVIGNWPDLPAHLHLTQLFEDEVVCMIHQNHPVVKHGLSLKHYVEMEHLAPSPYTLGHRNIIDNALTALGLKRKIHMTIPYFGMVPQILAKTDLIFTTSRSFALQCAKDWPIAVLPVPLAIPKMQFFMLWHERVHAAAEVQWLRRIVAEAASAVVAV